MDNNMDNNLAARKAAEAGEDLDLGIGSRTNSRRKNFLQTQAWNIKLCTIAGFLPFSIDWSDVNDEDESQKRLKPPGKHFPSPFAILASLAGRPSKPSKSSTSSVRVDIVSNAGDINKHDSKSGNAAGSQISAFNNCARWSYFSLLQLVAFLLVFGYGAILVARDGAKTLLTRAKQINLCVVTFGSCAVLTELGVWIGLLAFLMNLSKMKLLFFKMASFRLASDEFLQLRKNCRQFFSSWCFGLVSTLAVINGIKYSVPAPIELPILVALGEEVPRWPRYLGLFTIVLLDSFFVGIVHGFSEAFKVLNAELATSVLDLVVPCTNQRGDRHHFNDHRRRRQAERLNVPRAGSGNKGSDVHHGRRNWCYPPTFDDIWSRAASPVQLGDALKVPLGTERALFPESKKSRAELLEDVRLRYVALCDLVADARGAFASYLIVTIIDAGLHLMVVTYVLLTHSMKAICIGHTKFFFVMVGLTGISLVRIYAFCVVASGPETQVAGALRILSKVTTKSGAQQSGDDDEDDTVPEISIVKFYEELKLGNPVISAGGYFTVSKRLILSVVATVNTYLIILFQFSFNDTGNVHDLACLYSQFNQTARDDDIPAY